MNSCWCIPLLCPVDGGGMPSRAAASSTSSMGQWVPTDKKAPTERQGGAHLSTRWPFWLSPRQLLLCPVKAGDAAQCEAVLALQSELRAKWDIAVAVDVSDRPLRQKISDAEGGGARGDGGRYNCVGVVGAREVAEGSVDLRVVGQSGGAGDEGAGREGGAAGRGWKLSRSPVGREQSCLL